LAASKINEITKTLEAREKRNLCGPGIVACQLVVEWKASMDAGKPRDVDCAKARSEVSPPSVDIG
jgi:hypothetical protein